MKKHRISISFLPSPTRRHSFIINDIPKDLEAYTDEIMLATVLGSFLQTVVGHSEKCCIRISGKLCEGVVLIHVKETHRHYTPTFAGSLRQVQQLAEIIGGAISIDNKRNEATTIAFSFLNNNLPLAA